MHHARLRQGLKTLARVWVCAAVLLTGGPVWAETPQLAMVRYVSGEFLEAAAMAEARAGADELAFAARAVLAEIMTQDGEPDAVLVQRAERNATSALQIDPRHVEARLQLAIALSLRTRAMAPLEVWRTGLGEQGRDLAQGVLLDDPGNVYANGFLAVWHVEARRRAGAVGAGVIGASLQEARRRYQAAVKAAPDDPGVHWQYGRALIALDARRFAGEAGRALEGAVTSQAHDRVAEVMQARASDLLVLLKADRHKAEKRAREML
jgi:hypothetical protein